MNNRLKVCWHVHGLMLAAERDKQEVQTYYDNGKKSGGGVQDGDVYHAERLGITPFQHRWHHDVLHHLLGERVLGARGSLVLRLDADLAPLRVEQLSQAQREEVEREEWLVTAFAYHLAGWTRTAHTDDGIPVGETIQQIDLLTSGGLRQLEHDARFLFGALRVPSLRYLEIRS